MEPTPPVSAFAEDDARLAEMHGYEPLTPDTPIETLRPLLEARLNRLDRMVYELIEGQRRVEKALKAGAIGRWQ